MLQVIGSSNSLLCDAPCRYDQAFDAVNLARFDNLESVGNCRFCLLRFQVVLEEKQELEEETLQGEQAAKDGERLDETRTEPGQRYQATVGVPTAVEACLSRIDRFEQRHYTPEPADINLDLTGDASTLDLLRFMAQGNFHALWC